MAILVCVARCLPAGDAQAGTRLLMGTGGLAGVYYPIGSAISKIITSKVPGVEATVQTSAAGMENLRLLSLKEVDMGLVQNSDAYNAFNGLVFFKDKPIKNIRGIAVLYPQPIQVVVPLLVTATLYISTAILIGSSLSYLGLGVQPPDPTWGSIINEGREVLRIAPWISTFTGLVIMITILSFNILGDTLRDFLDPRLRRQI